MIVYVLHSPAWSAGGFLLGYTLGGLSRETMMGAVTMPARNKLTGQHLLGLVVVVLAAATMISAVSVQVRLERVTACQSQFNTAYHRALAERVDAADQERAAQKDLIVTIVNPVPDATPEQRRITSREALHRYLRALDMADKRRRDNPLPTLPCS